MTGPVPVAVFSDADGVLGASSPTAVERARQALAGLIARRIGVVLCSRWTRAEIEAVHQSLDLRQPFVVEGGAAVFIPAGYFGVGLPEAREHAGYQVLEFGPPYEDTVRILRDAATRLGVGVQGVSDMSVEAVAGAWGLALLRARLASLREYVEPFQVVGPRDGRTRLHRALEQAGLAVSSGDTFDYVGGTVSYAPATRALRRLYERAFGPSLFVRVVDGPGERLALDGADQQVVLGGHGRPLDLAAWADGVLMAVAAVRERQNGTGRPRRGTTVPRINQ